MRHPFERFSIIVSLNPHASHRRACETDVKGTGVVLVKPGRNSQRDLQDAQVSHDEIGHPGDRNPSDGGSGPLPDARRALPPEIQSG
jgi:hypothetical protein